SLLSWKPADSVEPASRPQRRLSDHRRLAPVASQLQSARAGARLEPGAMASARAPVAGRGAEAERARGTPRDPADHADPSDRPDGGGRMGRAASGSDRSADRAALFDR